MTPRLEILQAGEPVLRAPARPLSLEEIRSPELARLIADMRETMRAAPGVGLAAPQVGEPIQLAVIEDAAEYHRGVDPLELARRERSAVPFHVIVNPKITVVDPGPAEFFEGCLSVAGFTAIVPRAIAVRVECLNEGGEPVTLSARGWYARILQHEIDHLGGRLYVDRMKPRSFMSAANHARYWMDRPNEELRTLLEETRGDGARAKPQGGSAEKSRRG